MAHAQPVEAEGIHSLAVRYSGGNRVFTKEEDVLKTLKPLMTKVAREAGGAGWDAASILLQLVSYMILFTFPKDTTIRRITKEARQVIITRQSDELRQLLIKHEMEENTSNFQNNVFRLADKSLRYAAWLPIHMLNNPMHFCSERYRNNYIEAVSCTLLVLERECPNISWLDRLEDSVDEQLL